LANFLLIFSTCTIHFCRDTANLKSKTQDSLFNLAVKDPHILLLTASFETKFSCPTGAIDNNWHKNNFYNGGRYQGKKYKRGYWEIFKLSRFLTSCQLRILETSQVSKQIFSYLGNYVVSSMQEAKSPDYLLFIHTSTNLCKVN